MTDRRLSAETKHYRFLGGVNVREIAVTAADEWQHKGLGTLLMKQLIQSARSNGVKELHSIDLADNAAMCALATDLGMSAHTDLADRTQVVYSLSLQ